jgi:hypothetical protein
MRRYLLAFVIALAIVAPAGAWTWPAEGPVLQPFSFDPEQPKAPGFHRGIDVAGALGAAVRAPASGLVSFAGTVPGNGKCVTIETADGWSVTLTHLGSIAVTKGASVVEGDGVGTIGPSDEPGVSETHVHLGLRRTVDEFGYADPAGVLPPRAQAGAEQAASPAQPETPSPASPEQAQWPVNGDPAVTAAAPVAPVSSGSASGPGPSAGDPPPSGTPPPADVPPAPTNAGPPPVEQPHAEPVAAAMTSTAGVEADGPIDLAEPAVDATKPASAPDVTPVEAPKTTAVSKPATVVPSDVPQLRPSVRPPTPQPAFAPSSRAVERTPDGRPRVPVSSDPAPDERAIPVQKPEPAASSTTSAVMPAVSRPRVAASRAARPAVRQPTRALDATDRHAAGASRRTDAVPTSGGWNHRFSGPVEAVLVLLALLTTLGVAAAGMACCRRRPAPRPPRIIGAHVEWRQEDPGGTCVAVRRGPSAPRSRGGLRSPVGRLRALPPAAGERRAHGQRDGRARHAGDGRRGSRREVAR